jgi:hypothetical protein
LSHADIFFVTLEKVPAAQSKHSPFELPSLYVPEGQSPQEKAPVEADVKPIEHTVHFVDPVSLWKYPSEHELHIAAAVPSENAPTPQEEHSSEPVVAAYLPLGHAMHSEAPCSDENFPIWQLTQSLPIPYCPDVQELQLWHVM